VTYLRYECEKTYLPDGRYFIRYAYKGNQDEVPEDEYCRNVDLFRANGEKIWTIGGHPQNDTNITGVIVRGNIIEVINFYGVAYDLDINSGDIKMKDWRK
jgi:hypothetical protein